MDQQLTSLIALDADEASKLSILDDMLLEPRETPKSEEIRSLFWISLLSLSSPKKIEHDIGRRLCLHYAAVPYSKDFWSHFSIETLDEYFRQSLAPQTGMSTPQVPTASALYGINTLMSCKKRVNPENLQQMWAKVGIWISKSILPILDPVVHHQHFIAIFEIMQSSGVPIIQFSVLYRPLMSWILKTPLKPSNFYTGENSPETPHISKSYSDSLEWVLRLFKLATSSKSFGSLVINEIVSILLNAETIVSPLFPIILPAVSPELEQQAMSLSENIIFKVLPIILNWPTTNQVVEWTKLLFLRLRYLVTHQQPSKQEYHRQLTKWFTMVEQAIDVLCKNLFHRKTRSGAVSLLTVILNSLQRTPKPFLKSLPMLFEALKLYHEESQTAKAQNLPVQKVNALDIPLGISAVVSYLKILDIEHLAGNLSVLSEIPFSTNSKVTSFDSELDNTKLALSKLIVLQMQCHKGQPETYIPIHDYLKQNIAVDNTGKPYELISASEIESMLKCDSWNLIEAKSSSFDSKGNFTSQSFAEESEEDFLEFSALSGFGDYETAQRPDSLKQLGLCGLVNLGNTCYMNSVLQVLHQTVAFRNAVFTALPSQTIATPSLLRELQYTFASLLHTTRNAFPPRSLISALPDWVKGGRQHDASELEKAIFDILDSFWSQLAKKNEIATSPIQSLFGGKMSTSIRCKMCGNISERSDMMLDFALNFPGEDETKVGKEHSLPQLTLDGLIAHSMKPELMEGANQYRCDTCNALVDAEKMTLVETAPDHLIVNLVRFRYDYKTQLRSKILKEVEFKEQLQLPVRKTRNQPSPASPNSMDVDPRANVLDSSENDFAQMEAAQDDPESGKEWADSFEFSLVPYTLYGCVMHSGKSTEHGHYYSYARSSEMVATGELDAKLKPKYSLGPWYRFNDENVDSSSFESFSRITKHFPSDVAYILVYRRDDTSMHSEPTPSIPASIMKRLDEDNTRADQERRTKLKTRRAPRQALIETRSRFDDSNHQGGAGGSFGGPDMGFGGGFGGGWIS